MTDEPFKTDIALRLDTIIRLNEKYTSLSNMCITSKEGLLRIDLRNNCKKGVKNSCKVMHPG